MAIVLRKGNHCELVPPPWLNKSTFILRFPFSFLGFLENVLSMEHQLSGDYQALPEHYLEISLLLFEW